MSFPRYPRYRESGITSLGTVPMEWRVHPLKYVIASMESGTSVNASDEPAAEDGFGVLKTSCVYSGIFDHHENKTVFPEEYGRMTCQLRSDSIIVSRMNTPDLVGATGLVREVPENLYLPDRLWQITFSGVLPAFIYYWSQSALYRSLINTASVGTSSSMQNLAQHQYRSFPIAIPPQDEQSAIVAFLDREAAKTDVLIRTQQRLIDLLKEKRQAVISHAVTKGLNSNAPMTPSRVEWLGDVPEDWDTLQLKRICDVRDGTHDTPEFVEPGPTTYPLVTTQNLTAEGVQLEEAKHISEEDYLSISKRSGVAIGDLLMPMIGSIGGAILVKDRADFAIKNVALFKASSQFCSRWLQYVLNSRIAIHQFELQRSGGVQGFVGLGMLRNLIVPSVGIEEQAAIAEHLDHVTEEIDDLLAEVNRAIEVLQERRSVLISAAVTGKIDVRQAVLEPVA